METNIVLDILNSHGPLGLILTLGYLVVRHGEFSFKYPRGEK